MSESLENLIQKDKELFFNTYKRLRVSFVRGEGCYLYDSNGRKVLDMFAGLAVNILGYNHTRVIEAIHNQAAKYVHVSNIFYQSAQIEFALKLIKLSGYKKVFLCNSGTEATETAIKITRKYFSAKEKKINNSNTLDIVAFTGSFHGRTMGALSLTERPAYRAGYEPFLPNVKHLKFNSVENLNAEINENTAAVFLEFIQGESGINQANTGFINSLFELRKKYGFLIIADEIQAGSGRTGKFFSFSHYGVSPDIILLAKGIGGGLPLGAVIGNERVENVFSYGDHGSTFGGNPVSCAAGCVVLDELSKGLMDEAGKKGDYLISKLISLQLEFPDIIKDIRGKGLMIGIEFTFECSTIVQNLLENGILVNCTNNNVIRLLPPLVISINDINYFIGVLKLYLSGL
jgi:acetylornithine aminotransferase